MPKIATTNFNYVRLYFERALEINCDFEEIWELYIEICKALNRNTDLLISIMSRACKCCYSIFTFWVLLLTEMEKAGRPSEEIEGIIIYLIKVKITEAYSSATSNEHKIEIWKYSMEFFCRHYIENNLEQLYQIRNNFENAIKEIESKIIIY